jgi:SAM-dependent methyltransferase
VSVNSLSPPLEFAERFFDAVYAMSVFTHLPADLQRAWVHELSRVLRPDGLLLVTTHGDSYADRLNSEERKLYDGGELVVRRASVAGTNLCMTFHPEAYVRSRFAPGLELLEFVSAGAGVGDPRQDLALFRKRRVGGDLIL